ncbi:hypothetical protein E4T42_05191 [Aureobasidium subglaciale]|nr:hypothetical protein E4T42_05191 [Aureobasidium subglaciale]
MFLISRRDKTVLLRKGPVLQESRALMVPVVAILGSVATVPNSVVRTLAYPTVTQRLNAANTLRQTRKNAPSMSVAANTGFVALRRIFAVRTMTAMKAEALVATCHPRAASETSLVSRASATMNLGQLLDRVIRSSLKTST